MKTDTLQALLIDQALGELPPEVAELLDTHLADNAAARDEARRLTDTLDLTGETIRRFPERGHTGHPPNPVRLARFGIQDGLGQDARTTGGAGIAQVFGSSQLGYLRLAPVLPATILSQSGPGSPKLTGLGHPPVARKLVPFPVRWLGLAASLLLAALSAATGYLLGGRREATVASAAHPPSALSAAPVAASAPLPWTRYEVASDRGDLRVVRVNSNP